MEGFSGGSLVKNMPADAVVAGSIPESERPSGGGGSTPTPVFLPGDTHEQRSIADYCPQCQKE